MPQKIRGSEFFDFLDLIFDADCAGWIEGPPGSAKSSKARQYAIMKNAENPDRPYAFCYINMSAKNVADFRGYYLPQEKTVTGPNGESRTFKTGYYAYPDWLLDEFTGRPAFMFEHGMLVMDECDKRDPDLAKASAEIVLDKTCGNYSFKQFNVLQLANLPNSRNGGKPKLDFEINRRVEAELVPEEDDFLIHAAERGMTPYTMAFAKRAGAKLKLWSGEMPEKQGSWLTQRSLDAADRIIQSALRSGRDLKDPLVNTALSGAMGDAAALQYVAFIDARTKIPTITEITTNPNGAKVPQELDVTMFLVFDMASKATTANIGAFSTYLARLPVDMVVSFWNTVTANKATMALAMTPEFSAFARVNLPLLSVAAGRRKK